MARVFMFFGSLLAGLAVAMGAWEAHSSGLDGNQVIWIEKAVRYQMYHGLAMCCAALVIQSRKKAAIAAVVAGLCFFGGIVLFSGSLYCLAFGVFNPGLLTPVGGILFLFGWGSLALSAPGGR